MAALLLAWADSAAKRIGAERELEVQQIDSGAFADDARQHRWLEQAGLQHGAHLVADVAVPSPPTRPTSTTSQARASRIRLVEREGAGMPSEDDLRIVHDVLESAFDDHFNSHEETFDEFVFRLREDPGHRWDHWWIAELVETAPGPPSPPAPWSARSTRARAASRTAAMSSTSACSPTRAAAGWPSRCCRTSIADAAARGRDRVGLEVDADSPTGADGLYTSMGWATKYVTQSWHKDVPVSSGGHHVARRNDAKSRENTDLTSVDRVLG